MDRERQWGGFVKRSAGPGRPSKWVPQYERTLNYAINSEAERRLIETVASRVQAPQFYRNEAHVEIVAEVARIQTRVWQRVADLAADQEMVGRLFVGVTERDRDPYMQAILSPERPFGDAGAGPSHPSYEMEFPQEIEAPNPGNYYPVAPGYPYPAPEPIIEEVSEDESEEDPEEDEMEEPEVVNEVVEPDFPADNDLGEVVNPIICRFHYPAK